MKLHEYIRPPMHIFYKNVNTANIYQLCKNSNKNMGSSRVVYFKKSIKTSSGQGVDN